jgi:hypothetical protein
MQLTPVAFLAPGSQILEAILVVYFVPDRPEADIAVAIGGPVIANQALGASYKGNPLVHTVCNGAEIITGPVQAGKILVAFRRRTDRDLVNISIFHSHYLEAQKAPTKLKANNRVRHRQVKTICAFLPLSFP